MPDGLGSKDFRARASTGTLVRNGASAAAIDPISQGYEDIKKMAAAKMLGQQVKSLEADEIKAENERLKAQIENQQLQELAHPSAPPPQQDQWIQYILSKMDSTEKALADARVDARQAEQSMLHQQLDMLTGELSRIREVNASTENADDFDVISRKIDQAKSFIERFTPPAKPESVNIPMVDTSLEKWRMTLENEREQRRIEAEDRREERRMEFEKWQRAEERSESRLDREAELHNRFFTDTLPKLTPLFERFIGNAASSAAPSVAAQTFQTNAPAGFESMLCGDCGFNIQCNPKLQKIICPNCGMSYSKTPDDAPAPVQTAQENGHGMDPVASGPGSPFDSEEE